MMNHGQPGGFMDDALSTNDIITIAVLLGTAGISALMVLQFKYREYSREDTGKYLEIMKVVDLEPVETLETVSMFRLVADRQNPDQWSRARYNYVILSPDSEHMLKGSSIRGRVIGEEIVEFVPPYDIEAALDRVAEDLGATRESPPDLNGTFRGYAFWLEVDGEWVGANVELLTEHKETFWIEFHRDASTDQSTHDHNRDHHGLSVRFGEDSLDAYETYVEPAIDELAALIEPENLIIYVDDIEVCVACEAIVSPAVIRFLLAKGVEIAQHFEVREVDEEEPEMSW